MGGHGTVLYGSLRYRKIWYLFVYMNLVIVWFVDTYLPYLHGIRYYKQRLTCSGKEWLWDLQWYTDRGTVRHSAGDILILNLDNSYFCEILFRYHTCTLFKPYFILFNSTHDNIDTHPFFLNKRLNQGFRNFSFLLSQMRGREGPWVVETR